MINRKKLLLPICMISLLLTGCRGDVDLNPDKIHVDFKTFAITDTSNVNTVSVKEINLDDERITDENIENIINNIKYVYDTLGDYEYNLDKIGEIKLYYTPIESYCTPTFYETLCKSNHYIYETMMDIYKEENHGYYGTNITEIDVLDTKHLEVMVEVLSIKDGTLYSQTKKLTLTNEGKIDNIEKLESLHSVENSLSPLYSTNFSNMNDKFKETLSKFLSSISNGYLYEKYAAMKNGSMTYKDEEEKTEKEKEIQLQVETLLQKDGMNVETLEKVFESGKGKYEDYGIVSYVIKNTDNREDTIYKVGFVYNQEIRYFNITYSRLLDQIINVEEMEE